jgi:hypothetical protein
MPKRSVGFVYVSATTTCRVDYCQIVSRTRSPRFSPGNWIGPDFGRADVAA